MVMQAGMSDQRRGLFDDLEDENLTDQEAEAPVPNTDESPVPENEPTAVPEPESDFDINTPEGVAKAAERSEALRNYLEKVRLDTANAERVRYQNELRREQGTSERAAAYHQSVIDRLLAGENPEALKREIPVYVAANQGWAQAQVVADLLEQAVQFANDDQKKEIQGILSEADSPGAITKAAEKAVEFMLSSHADQTLANLDFNNLKEHPRFGEWLTNEVKARMEEEMKAQETQSKSRPQAPAVPSGAASTGGISAEQFVSMDKAAQDKYLSNLTDEQEDALMTALYEAARGG